MKLQTIIEWAIGVFVSVAGAIGVFFTVRAGYILYLKENSVGREALKKRDEKIEVLERKFNEMELKHERAMDKIKVLERDNDDHYEDMSKLDEKLDALNKEVKNKTI